MKKIFILSATLIAPLLYSSAIAHTLTSNSEASDAIDKNYKNRLLRTMQSMDKSRALKQLNSMKRNYEQTKIMLDRLTEKQKLNLNNRHEQAHKVLNSSTSNKSIQKHRQRAHDVFQRQIDNLDKRQSKVQINLNTIEKVAQEIKIRPNTSKSRDMRGKNHNRFPH